jgi:hypothetical protein
VVGGRRSRARLRGRGEGEGVKQRGAVRREQVLGGRWWGLCGAKIAGSRREWGARRVDGGRRAARHSGRRAGEGRQAGRQASRQCNGRRRSSSSQQRTVELQPALCNDEPPGGGEQHGGPSPGISGCLGGDGHAHAKQHLGTTLLYVVCTRSEAARCNPRRTSSPFHPSAVLEERGAVIRLQARGTIPASPASAPRQPLRPTLSGSSTPQPASPSPAPLHEYRVPTSPASMRRSQRY